MSPPSLRRRLISGVVLPVSACAGFAVMYGVDRVPDVTTIVQQAPAARSIPSPTERMLFRHHCWVNRAPRDSHGAQVMPTHVVVRLPGARRPTYGGRVLTGVALDHVFKRTDPDLAVAGFCR